MERKEDAVRLIQKKLDGKTFMTYKDIAGVTGYHPKYILKLKKVIVTPVSSITYAFETFIKKFNIIK